MASNHYYSQLRMIPREKALCFTGHRPEKLPKGLLLETLTQVLHRTIDEAIGKGFQYFLVGMADGIDYMALEYLVQCRNENPDIQIIGIQPCEDYDEFFRVRRYSTEHLQYMRKTVNVLVCMPGSYHHNKEVFSARNHLLTDYASAIIAVCSKASHSGSVQTLSYARKKGLAVCHIAANPKLLYTPPPEQWPVRKDDRWKAL